MTEQSLQDQDPNTVIHLTVGELRLLLIEARINMVKYYDQSPTNKDTDWKGLFKDNLDALEYEHTALSNIVERLGDDTHA